VTAVDTSSKWADLRPYRTILAWIAVGATASLFLATWAIEPRYPTELSRLGGPRAPEWMYTWRLASGCIVLVTSVLSFPRWQSIVALLGLIGYAFFFGGV
jgi:cytochrome c-type biogenesis protein CcmH/NrfG